MEIPIRTALGFIYGLLKKQIIFDLGGSEVRMSLGHFVGQVSRSFVQALSSSESAYTVLGVSEIFWAELVIAWLYSSEEAWCVKGDVMRNQVLFPVIIHPVMCHHSCLNMTIESCSSTHPELPQSLLLTTGFSSSVFVWYTDTTSLLFLWITIMTQAEILIYKVLAAGKDRLNKARSLSSSCLTVHDSNCFCAHYLYLRC